MIVICLYIFALCASPLVSSYVAKHHVQKRAACGLSEHTCNDGVCVNYERVCDGRIDCTDGGDERGCRHNAMSYVISIEGPFNRSISNTTCLRNQWQCRDATCISFERVCNRVLDCPDSSDETITLCHTTQPITSVFVVTATGAQPTLQLAMQPGQVDMPAIQPEQVDLPVIQPGQVDLPVVEPEPGSQSGNNESSSEGTGKLRTCKLVPHPSVIYHCVDSYDNARDCTSMEPAGADVIPECAQFYYYPASLPPMRCIDGYWDYVARCTPDCGRVLSGEGMADKVLTWHAVLYRKNTEPYQRVCGGSLISQAAVITAARCFWSGQTNTQIESAEFAVAVGKRYEQWDAANDGDTQTSNVQKVLLSPSFRGIDVNYQGDIAIAVLAKSLVYSPRVGPVCLDSNIDFDKIQLRPGNIGKVAGWWLEGKPSMIQVRELPYVDIVTCINKTSDRYRGFITSDKICAGNQSSSTFCAKDIGAGLAFEYKSRSRSASQYYLRGIASTPLNENSCNAMDHVTFTQILKHKSFIIQNWNDIHVDRSTTTAPSKPQQSKCILPPVPNHGTYVTTTGLAANDDNYELVTLTVTCHPGHGILGPSSIKCYNGFWPDKVPRCIQMCQLPVHPSVEYRCLLSGAQVGLRACAIHEPPGTVVSPRCREPHYYSASPLPFMRCEDHARWNYIARCKPDCGRATPKGQELAVGGSNAKHGELPWHAGIYDKTATPYMQVCGVSLISSDLVISAAHCFWKQRRALPESQFAVAVGKLYRPWNDPVDDAQKSEVKRIHLPPRFRGSDANFQDDIAVIVVSRAFEYRSFVRPVCLSFDTNFERRQLQTINKGKVAGWGLTSQNGKPSPVLQVVELPYVEVDTCIAKSPDAFVQYITSDKICAGTTQANTALCRGDSGGGLVFPATDSYIERYYLRGIVSTAPADENFNECNTAVYTSFTQILQHEDFIVPYLNDF